MSLTPGSIRGLVGSVLSQRYDDPVQSPEVHDEWWGMACSKARLVAIAAPRYHAKSTAITHAYLMAMMLFREASFALIVSDTLEQASKFLGDITADLTDNEDLIALFGITGFEKDSESAIVVNCSDGHQFRVEAKGAGQKLRGTKWNQKRPDLVIVDDLENEELVNTREQRTKLKRWVNGALIPCMSRKGKLRAVGTVIHSDSWLASVLPNEASPLTIHKPLSVTNKLLNNGWLSAKYRGHPAIGDYSCFLWPEYHDETFFRSEYERLAADGQADVYSAEQLNEPIDCTNAYFIKNDFRPLPKDVPFLNYYVGVDFAISKAQSADYTVFAVVGIDDASQLYLMDVVRGRFDPDESVKAIFEIEEKYHPGAFFCEKGTLAHSMGAALKREMNARHVYPMLQPVQTSGDKRMKARGIQKVMRGGAMYFDRDADWWPAFEDELLRFDRARHDDQVDAVAMVGLKLDELLDAPTVEDRAQDEWEDEHEDEEQGRNKVTGY